MSGKTKCMTESCDQKPEFGGELCTPCTDVAFAKSEEKCSTGWCEQEAARHHFGVCKSCFNWHTLVTNRTNQIHEEHDNAEYYRRKYLELDWTLVKAERRIKRLKWTAIGGTIIALELGFILGGFIANMIAYS